MAITDQLQIIKELRDGPGETVEERTDAVLSKRGWDRHLANIVDDDFRGLVRHALERLALRGGPVGTARDIEQERQHKRETEKIAKSGMVSDFFMDQLVGLTPTKLVNKLPREQYWVESLGRFVPRDELASQLHAVAELRRIAHMRLLEINSIADVYRWEVAIFDELLRQAAASHRAEETVA